jgi:hypothetical protein
MISDIDFGDNFLDASVRIPRRSDSTVVHDIGVTLEGNSIAENVLQ